MGSPSSNKGTGSVVGTGGAITVRAFGYRPKTVKLHQGGVALEWQEGMASDSAYKRVAGGAGSFVAVGGITPLVDGFQIGADADLNVVGATIRWEASE
jgi:hypothetical protein